MLIFAVLIALFAAAVTAAAVRAAGKRREMEEEEDYLYGSYAGKDEKELKKVLRLFMHAVNAQDAVYLESVFKSKELYDSFETDFLDRAPKVRIAKVDNYEDYALAEYSAVCEFGKTRCSIRVAFVSDSYGDWIAADYTLSGGRKLN